jgi:valyl-tRNA synthetase
MKGIPSLWLPGVDHASIATQYMVQQTLTEEGLDRHEMGREQFLERVWEWVIKYRGLITQQHKKLGVSCDWSRETFTMDAGPSRAVRTTFFNLYNKGLIYRGERITNWCPHCTTVLSDLEVDHKELSGQLTYIKYQLVNEDGFVSVATTRPETLLGDTGIAVNPGDVRFKNLIGKRVIVPAIGREIPIVADEAVDPSFGTGAVKVKHHEPGCHPQRKCRTLSGSGPFCWSKGSG